MKEASGRPLRPFDLHLDAEKAPQVNEDRYRLVARLASDFAYSCVDQGGNGYEVDWITDAFFSMTGYSEADLRQQKCWLFTSHPEDLDMARSSLLRLRSGEKDTCELRLITKDGCLRWVRNTVECVAEVQAPGGRRLYGAVQDITERRSAEEALRRSEARNRALLEAMPDMFFLLDRDGVFLDYASPTLEELFVPPDRFLGRHVVDVLPGELAELTLSHLRDILDCGQTPPYRYKAEVRGEIRRYESRMVRCGEDQALSIVRDVTDQKRAEEGLRLQHDLSLALSASDDLNEALQLVLKAAIGLPGIDCGGVYTAIPNSDAFDLVAAYGLSPEFVAATSRRSANSPQALLFKSGKAIYSTYSAIRSAGDERTDREKLLALATIPILHHGELIAVLNLASHTHEEIPESVRSSLEALAIQIGSTLMRIRIHEELRESRENLQTLFDTVNDFLFVLDSQSRIRQVNAEACERLGYLEEELIGKNILMIHPAERRAEARQIIADMLAGLRDCCLVPLETKSGELIPVETRMTPGAWGGEPALFVVSRDISERKRLEEGLQNARTDLLFAVSHELKTPLMTMLQSQELLAGLDAADALTRFREYQEIWQRNLVRLHRMVNNLVDSQRSQESRFPLCLGYCNPAEVITRVCEDLQPYIQTLHVQMSLQLDQVPEGSCDEEAIGRVVENLISNAVKFSPKEGVVGVRLGLEGETLVLEVENQGLGIPLEEQERLFQPFQRGRSAERRGVPGTGLGLYVARRIIEEHGGTLILESEEGKGTRVIVRLPWRIIHENTEQ